MHVITKKFFLALTCGLLTWEMYLVHTLRFYEPVPRYMLPCTRNNIKTVPLCNPFDHDSQVNKGLTSERGKP